MTRPFLLLGLLLGLLATASCSGGATDAEAPTAPVALVTLAPVTAAGVADRVTLYGVAEAGAAGTATLSAPAEVQLVRIVAPVGTRVAAGAVVAELAPAPTTRLDLVKAATDARAADAAFARAQRLRADGLVGDTEVEQARAAATSANATRASLGQRAGATTLRAPFAGFVQTVTGNAGDLLQPGTAIATVARLGDVRAHFGADPALARALRPGQPLRIEASTGRAAFAVPIGSVAPLVDPQTKLAGVFATLPGSAGVAIGETLTGTAATRTSVDALTIPYAALLDDGGQPYVFVVSQGVAHRRDVATGASQGDRIAVTHGVRPGERVVVDGGTAVDDGMKVRTR